MSSVIPFENTLDLYNVIYHFSFIFVKWHPITFTSTFMFFMPCHKSFQNNITKWILSLIYDFNNSIQSFYLPLNVYIDIDHIVLLYDFHIHTIKYVFIDIGHSFVLAWLFSLLLTRYTTWNKYVIFSCHLDRRSGYL